MVLRCLLLLLNSTKTWLFRLYMYLVTKTWMFLIISKTSSPCSRVCGGRWSSTVWVSNLWHFHFNRAFMCTHQNCTLCDLTYDLQWPSSLHRSSNCAGLQWSGCRTSFPSKTQLRTSHWCTCLQRTKFKPQNPKAHRAIPIQKMIKATLREHPLTSKDAGSRNLYR